MRTSKVKTDIEAALKTGAKIADIAKQFEVSTPYVYHIRSNMAGAVSPAKTKPKAKTKAKAKKKTKRKTSRQVNRKSRVDMRMVEHPAHYIAPNGLEAIHVIESFGLNYRVGNAVAYLLRQASKGGATDLAKARWYIDREISTSKKASK